MEDLGVDGKIISKWLSM